MTQTSEKSLCCPYFEPFITIITWQQRVRKEQNHSKTTYTIKKSTIHR